MGKAGDPVGRVRAWVEGILAQASDPEASAQVLGLETVPEVPAPVRANYWPVIGAFSLGAVVLGLGIGSTMFFLGCVGLAVTGIEWAVRAWADRATGDPEVNQSIRDRFLGPVEVPGLAALGVAGLVLAVSRILLALPKEGSYVVFGLVPAIILVLAYLVVSRPQLSQSAIAGMLLIGAVALLFVGLATRRREVGAMLVALLVANLFDLTFFSSGLAYGAALAAGFSRRTREHA